MCVAIRRHTVCAKRSIRTYVQCTTVQHKVTKPHGLYIVVSRILNTHISPHHINTHTYIPCCCSTLYGTHPIGNWLGSIARWVKDWVEGGEGHTGGWGAGEKEKESVNAVAQKTSKLSRNSTTCTQSHTYTVLSLLHMCMCAMLSSFSILNTSFILHSILCA